LLQNWLRALRTWTPMADRQTDRQDRISFAPESTARSQNPEPKAGQTDRQDGTSLAPESTARLQNPDPKAGMREETDDATPHVAATATAAGGGAAADGPTQRGVKPAAGASGAQPAAVPAAGKERGASAAVQQEPQPEPRRPLPEQIKLIQETVEVTDEER
jgi:hypothetical protein